MHEMSIAQSLLRIVQETMQQNAAKRLHRIKLVAGQMNAVAPQSLHTAFELLARDTPLQGAELLIETVPVTMLCAGCQQSFSPEGDEPQLLLLARCPSCGSESGHQLESGRELYLEYIEAE
jgi:hydrogenase nickel incorporation protein HypA/HybF